MKKTSLVIISVLIFLALLFALFKIYENITGIDKSIRLGMDFISHHTLKSGKFVYRTHVDPRLYYPSSKYNSKIHAEVLYGMYLGERYLKNSSLKEERYIASDYLIKNYISQINANMYAVVSKVGEENDVTSPVAKLGSTGLALCSLSNLYPEGKIDLKILQGLGDFIIYMQKSDGSFYSKYSLIDKTRSDALISFSYPGVAALGLLFLNDVDPNKKWVDASKKTLFNHKNLIKHPKYKEYFDYSFVIAAKKLFETPDNGLSDDEKRLLQTDVENMTYAVLDKQVTDKKSPYRGSFGNIRSYNVAVVVEGLNSAYYVTDDKKLKKKIRKALKQGTDFLSRYQIKEGKVKGGIPADVSGDSTGAGMIRIDTVQHALSAWILYKQIGLFK